MRESIAGKHIALGRMAYDAALKVQMDQADALLALRTDEQTVFTVEHPPTITIGRSGSTQNIVASPSVLEQEGIVVRDVDRGGDVTYHGPGQLVVYPVLHLKPWQNDVGHYVRLLEEVVIESLKTIDLIGERDSNYPGVWVNGEKICAVGCRVRRRKDGEFVTHHGIALNVTTHLPHFATIVPCGIQDRGVTSIAKCRHGFNVESLAHWEALLMQGFEAVFGLKFSHEVFGDE